MTVHWNQGVCGHSTPVAQQVFFIVSVHKQAIPAFMQFLNANKKPHKQLVGKFEGKSEISWMIDEPTMWDAVKQKYLIGQKCVLRLGPCNARGQRPAELWYLDEGRKENLGYFTEQPLGVRWDEPSWTYDIETSTFFMCHKKER